MKFLTFFLIIPIFISCANGLKYQSWFYWFDRAPAHYLSTLLHGVCSDVLDDYYLAMQHGDWHTNASIATCYSVESCILDNIPSSNQANYQAASVILGLMPQFLSALAPSTSEILLLSTTRPILSVLIGLAAPAAHSIRMLSFKRSNNTSRKKYFGRVLSPQSFCKAAFYSLVEYVLVFGAVANVVQVAIVLGQKSILTWSCTFDWAPLIWGLMPLFWHGTAIINRQIEAHKVIYRSPVIVDIEHNEARKSRMETKGHLVFSVAPFLQNRSPLRWWQREVTICANQPQEIKRLLKNHKSSAVEEFIDYLCNLCVFSHIWFGTIILASLNFVAVYDILTFVFWRYMLSTLVCRVVLMFELWGLTAEENESECSVDRKNKIQAVSRFSSLYDIVLIVTATRSDRKEMDGKPLP